MQQPYTNDSLDDTPDRAIAGGFVGVDKATNPTLLEPGMLQDGLNVYLKGDGIARTRPAFYLNANIFSVAPSSSSDIRGMAYYDLPDYEQLLVYGDERVTEVPSNAPFATTSSSVSYGGTVTGEVPMVQHIDRVFYLRNGVLNWQMRSGGVWTAGTLTTFSDGSAMPLWSKIATQGFRLFLMEANGYKLYASAIGSAHLAANWVKTENIRVGSGEGDPARALIPSRAQYLTMLTARAAWQIVATDASVANWSSLRVTGLTGCVEGKTAIAIGQDVFFLSRYGVVSLNSLTETISISQQAAISAPLQPYIDRINWSAIDKAFATAWNDLYIIAVPLDNDTRPKHLLCYNVRTQRWSTPWTFTPPANAATSVAFGGFTYACVCNFGDRAETVIADSTGRIWCINTGQGGSGLFQDYTDGYATQGIPVTITPRSFHHDQPDARKQAFLTEAEFYILDGTAAGSVSLTLSKDGKTAANIATGLTIGGIPYSAANIQRVRLNTRGIDPTNGPYRDATVSLSAPNGRVALRSLTLHAFLDAPDFTTT